jgi:hypothetical protein
VRPSLRLDTLAGTAARRALSLRQLVVDRAPVVGGWSSADQRAISYAVIEGANLWEGYSRAFYLSSALGAREPGGERVQIKPTIPIASVNDALTVAVHRVAPDLRNRTGPWRPQEEPNWGGQLAVCFAELGASNFPKLERAVGLEPDALNHMRALRNFFAHKGYGPAKKTKALTKKYGLRGEPHPVDFLLSSAQGKKGYAPGEVIILHWFEVLYRAIRLTVEPLPLQP